MRRLSVVLGVAAVMAAIVALMTGTALAQAETDTSQTTEPLSFLLENPCNGEEILVEGEVRVLSHTTQNEQGSHSLFLFTEPLSGTGLETGDKYRFITVGHETTRDLANGVNGFAGTQPFLVTSEGASPNFIFFITHQAVFDDDGQPTHDFQTAVFGCTSDIETIHLREPPE